MKRLRLLAPVGLLILLLGVSSHPEESLQGEEKAQKTAAEKQRNLSRIDRAVAVLQPIGRSGASGTIHFVRQSDGMIRIRGEVSGLEPGRHGFHIHEFGDLSDPEAGKSAGGHYNPTDMPHGAPEDEKRHVGDLGNIEADQRGRARIDMEDNVIQLQGPHSILGRAVVVHADSDKFTQPTGDAGARVAFGVIGIAQPKSRE